MMCFSFFSLTERNHSYEISSFVETSAMNRVKENPVEFVKYLFKINNTNIITNNNLIYIMSFPLDKALSLSLLIDHKE